MAISSVSSTTATPASSTSALTSSSTTANATLSQFKAQQGSSLLSLIPAPSSSPGLGLSLDIYAAVGAQSQGLLGGGLTAIELANISLGVDMSKQTATTDGTTPGSSSSSSTGDTPAATSSSAASSDTTAPDGTTDTTTDTSTDGIAAATDPNSDPLLGTNDSTDPATGTDQYTYTSVTPPTVAQSTAANDSATHTNTILDQILKQDGYVAPPPDPYVVQTDFFAPTQTPASTAFPAYPPAAASATAASGAAAISAASAASGTTALAPSSYYINPNFTNPGLGSLLNSLA